MSSVTFRDKLYFNFDGIWSNSMDLMSVTLDNGMFEEALTASRSIVETEINGSVKPVFHKIEDSPLEFDLVVAFEDDFDRDKIDTVVDWIFKDYYRPLYFENRENRIYNCIMIGDPNLVHNGYNRGYFTITCRCDSSRLYSPNILTDKFEVDLSKEIEINNDSHFEVYPEISIRKNGSGGIVLEFPDDNGEIFQVLNLEDGEDIYIDCEREIIESDIIGVYRYDDVSGLFPRLIKGRNKIIITGDCTIQFRYKKEYRI